MGKSKDLFMEMMEGLLWDTPLLRMKQMLDNAALKAEREYEGLEEESFEVTKGEFKTVITCRFNKKGYPVSYSYDTEYIGKGEPSKEDLQKQLSEAVEKQDFNTAAQLKKKLDKLKTN